MCDKCRRIIFNSHTLSIVLCRRLITVLLLMDAGCLINLPIAQHLHNRCTIIIALCKVCVGCRCSPLRSIVTLVRI